MQIISYVGYGNNKQRVFENIKEHFQKSRRRNSYSDYSLNYSSVAAVPNGRVRSSEGVSFKDFVCSLGSMISYLQKNFRKVLVIAGVAAAFSGIAVLMNNIADYSKSHTGPLDVTGNADFEIETLNLIMSQFVMEEYTDEVGLGDEITDQKIEQIFSQPVTFQTYKVQSGDTISGITKKFGLKNISTLIAVNDIDNVRQISAGQKLKIPSVDGLIYTVQAGNSIQGISSKYKVTLEDLLDVNDLDSDKLFAGQQLFIPGAKLDNETLHNALGDQFKCPLATGYRLTSYFGHRKDPFTGAASNHTGIDMACPTGTPISASMSGKVAFVGYSNIFGNYVIINHSKGYQTLYAHMSKILATKGQWVTQGTRIGLVGSTGYSTGPHLHFTVYKNGKLVDPLSLIKR